jgi:hypothetical protein
VVPLPPFLLSNLLVLLLSLCLFAFITPPSTFTPLSPFFPLPLRPFEFINAAQKYKNKALA